MSDKDVRLMQRCTSLESIEAVLGHGHANLDNPIRQHYCKEAKERVANAKRECHLDRKRLPGDLSGSPSQNSARKPDPKKPRLSREHVVGGEDKENAPGVVHVNTADVTGGRGRMSCASILN